MTLVLGVTQNRYVDKLPVDSPPYRDIQRIISLSSVLKDEDKPVYTLDKNSSYKTRINAFSHNISKRGAIKLSKSLPDNFQFRIIIGDYFRFPSEYFRQAFREVVPFLSELKNRGRLHKSIRIYFPILQNSPPFTLTTLKRVLGFAKYVKNKANPLFYATDKLESLSKQQHGDPRVHLAGYLNKEQMMNYKGFVCATTQFMPTWKPMIRSSRRCKRNCKITRCGAINRQGKQCCLCTRHYSGLCHHHRNAKKSY